MAHRIVALPGIVEIVHSGTVGYAERLSALDDVSAAHGSGCTLPVLINFADATLAQETHRDEHDHARADYIARATLHPFFNGRRVAMVGAPYEVARPVVAAASARRVQFRLFEDREEALAWLAAAPEPVASDAGA